MKTYVSLSAVIMGGMLLAASAPAGTLVDSWSYNGGALNPNTYSALGEPGKYRPAVLTPDSTANHGATVQISGTTSGGLGSSSFPDGYGFYYTFFSPAVNFTLQTVNVVAGLDSITVRFNSGGGTTFTQNSLLLNFNSAHRTAAPTAFSTAAGGTSDFGPLTIYSWTWNVASFGATSGFSLAWVASEQHTTFGDISLIQQSIPEPSSLALAVLGVGGFFGLRRRRKKT